MVVKKVSKGQGYECGVCGYAVVVDSACGCGEEHVLVCCGRPMKKAARKTTKKPAAKKAAGKK